MALRGQDAWRRHPIFRWGVADALPGLREGAAAFGLFVAAGWLYDKFGPAPEPAHGHGGHAGGHAGAHGEPAAAPPPHGAGH